MNRMDGKVCVVTGATQGLGAAIARRLAEAGAKAVVITGRNAERGAHVAHEIAETHGIRAHFLQADFSRVEDCRMVVSETDRLFGRLDVLVNAGASTARGTILDTTPETFDALFATNVRGPYFLMQEAIRLMIAKGIEGAICNIGSISALAGQPFTLLCADDRTATQHSGPVAERTWQTIDRRLQGLDIPAAARLAIEATHEVAAIARAFAAHVEVWTASQ